MTAIRAAAANPAHVLNKHKLLVPRPVVVHDRQHRKLVMHGSPQDTGSVVEVAVGLNVDDHPAATLRRQSCSDRGGRSITHTSGALSAEIAIRLVVIPQLSIVTAGEAGRRG